MVRDVLCPPVHSTRVSSPLRHSPYSLSRGKIGGGGGSLKGMTLSLFDPQLTIGPFTVQLSVPLLRYWDLGEDREWNVPEGRCQTRSLRRGWNFN